MAKGKNSVFFCQNCGYESSKWMGQCPACKEWNSFVEETISKSASGKTKKLEYMEPSRISEIETNEEERIKTGMQELDRVLGGGIVQGSLVLVGGDPGIGKSTLLLQVCQTLTTQGKTVLYISGEESLKQIKMRALRIGQFTNDLLILCETNLELASEAIKKLKPQVVVIDSIQTMYNEAISAAPGSVSQVRESTSLLMQLAKGNGISIFIVGHVTKEGVVAGPRDQEYLNIW